MYNFLIDILIPKIIETLRSKFKALKVKSTYFDPKIELIFILRGAQNGHESLISL